MKVYPDHNVMSGIARQDLVEQELDALKKILEWYQASKLDLRISKIHYKELEGYGDQKRREDIKKLLAGYMNVPFVEVDGMGSGLRFVICDPDETADESRRFEAKRSEFAGRGVGRKSWFGP